MWVTLETDVDRVLIRHSRSRLILVYEVCESLGDGDQTTAHKVWRRPYEPFVLSNLDALEDALALMRPSIPLKYAIMGAVLGTYRALKKAPLS